MTRSERDRCAGIEVPIERVQDNGGETREHTDQEEKRRRDSESHRERPRRDVVREHPVPESQADERTEESGHAEQGDRVVALDGAK